MVKFLSKSQSCAMALNLLEVTEFASLNLSLYFNFLRAVPRCDVIKRTRFLIRPPETTHHLRIIIMSE